MTDTQTEEPTMTKTPDPLVVLRDLQHGDGPGAPRLDLVTAKEILDMLPDSLRGEVSDRWIRRTVPGRRRVGRQDMWPRTMVLDYFLAAGMT
jgi:hypothetical protein